MSWTRPSGCLGGAMPDRILRDWTDSEAVTDAGEQAESLFIRLIQKADDYGCLEANPKVLRAILYPLREDIRAADIVKRMQKCAAVGLVSVYEVTGTGATRWLSNDELTGATAVGSKWFVFIHNFGQRIREPAPKPKCEPPPETAPPNILADDWRPPPIPRQYRDSRRDAATRGDSPPYSSANANASAPSKSFIPRAPRPSAAQKMKERLLNADAET